MTPWHRRLHRARWWLLRLLAAYAIFMAVVSSLTQLVLLPWVTNHPEVVARKLGEALRRPVVIDHLYARWERTGPLLDLAGVHLGVPQTPSVQGDAGRSLVLASAGLKINFFAWAQPGANWTEIRLSGVELDLVRDAQKQWRLGGFDTESSNAAPSLDDNALFGLGTVVIRGAKLAIDDVPNDKHFRLGADELRLKVQGNFLRARGRIRNLDTPDANSAAPIEAVIEYDRARREGRAYLGGTRVDLAAVLRNYPLKGLIVDRGGGKLQVWAWLRDGELREVRAEVDVTGLVLAANASIKLDEKHDFLPRVGMDRIAFGARWMRDGSGWSADLVNIDLSLHGLPAPSAQLHLRRRDPSVDAAAGAMPEYVVDASAIDLGAVASAAMLVEALPVDLRRWLYAANPSGTLARATLRFVDADNFDAAAQLDGFATHAFGKIPGVNGLSGKILADPKAITFELPQHNALAVSLPGVFREPLGFSEFHGSIAAYRNEAGWRVETDALRFENATQGSGFGGELRGTVDLADAGGKPALDLAAVIAHGEVPAAHRFWPINVMPAHAVTWLDRALAAGDIVGGRAVFRGDLSDWPFRNNRGRFEAAVEVADLHFHYVDEWPEIEHAHAFVDFVNAGLHADVDGGDLPGMKINKGSVDISDYGEGTLAVAASAQSSGRDLLGFIRVTPLATRFSAPLLGVEAGGQGKIDFALNAPMNPIEKFQIEGKVQIADANLSDAKYDLKFDKASGLLRFNRNGFSADALTTTFKDRPAKFSLAVGSYVDDTKHVVESKVDVRLPVRDVLAYAPALKSYEKYLSGETNWSARFSADRDDIDKPREGSGQRLTLTSDLRDIAIDLPAPLNKAAADTLPLRLVFGLPFLGASLDASLGDILNLHGRLPTPTLPFAANAIFGGEASDVLPKSGFAIGGAAHEVDLSGWMNFAADRSGSNGEDVLQSVDIRASSLLAWGRAFGSAKLRLSMTADTIHVDFDGPHIEGRLGIPRKDLHASTIIADFKRLYWPESPEPPADAAPIGEVRDDSLDPAAIPPLRIGIDDFRLGKANYGKAEVATTPIAEGMRLDKVDAHSQDIDMRAHGVWTRHNGFHRSTFGIELKAKDFGAMLEALGYGGKLAGGEIAASIDASWAGTPSAFALSRINGGALHMKIADGRIPEIDPGAGRLAGLLNLAALPRRLAFDFGDLFRKGFSFDSADGAFTFTDGYAYTDGFSVKSPSADLLIRGAIGLKNSVWNLRVEVTPHIGATVFAGIGAVVGGPPGAAVGGLLGGVLGKPINQATQSEYKVAGTWDKPEIVKLGSRQATQPKRAATQAGASRKPP